MVLFVYFITNSQKINQSATIEQNNNFLVITESLRDNKIHIRMLTI